MKVLRPLWILIFIGAHFNISALNHNSDSLNKKKAKQYKITGLGGTVLTHAALYQLWYKDYPFTRFHFFNDNKEWLQMDKAGHMYSSYYLGIAAIEAAKDANVPENKRWLWGLFGTIFQTPIEVWDGFSSGWGASAGDIAANSMGTILASGQELLFKEQVLSLKFSYTPSSFASIRPNILGDNTPQKILKDYNAQTYWLCYHPKRKGKRAFLGLAMGYGADGMLGGDDNIWQNSRGTHFDYSHIERSRQFYLSPDFNLEAIPTDRPWLKTLFFVLNGIKLPSPALLLNKGKLSALPFYF